LSNVSIEFGSDNALKASKALEAKHVVGLEVVVGSQNQLMIDYDVDEFPQERFEKGLNYLKQRLNPFTLNSIDKIKYFKYRSKSGKHWHVIIEVPIKFEDMERLIWQQIFGSDFQRDALSTIAISRKVKNPILLFMKKDKIAEETEYVSIVPISRKFKEVC